jgi:hypothetical protein
VADDKSMSQETPADRAATRVVVYRIPGMDRVEVRRDVEYRAAEAGPLLMDLYYPPPPRPARPLSAVVIVAGYPDPGFQKALGCRFKDMGSSVSWCRLLAASGMVAIAYANREPASDFHVLLDQLRRHDVSLGIDRRRVGVWASSGNVPLALSALMHDAPQPAACAALCYGYTLDLDGATAVGEASRQWGFVNPCAGKSIDDLLPGAPVFVARAGQDLCPGLNDGLDRFVAKALARDLPLSLVNHPAAPHAFDVVLDSDESREVVRQVLGFLGRRLGAPAADEQGGAL